MTRGPVALWSKIGEVLDRVAEADRLLACFDYDGTLAQIAPTPAEAIPEPESAARLSELAETRGTIAAVVTGRRLSDLDSLVSLPKLWRVGGHGIERARPGGPPALLVDAEDLGRRLEPVRGALRDFPRRFPGVFVEEKTIGLALHTRNAAPPVEAEAKARFREASAGLEGFDLLSGKRILELRPEGYDKGRAVLALREELAPGALVLYAGDDTTDEDAFERLSVIEGEAITVRVAGEAETRDLDSRARYVIGTVDDVKELLGLLVEARGQR